MPATQLRGQDVFDGSICRADLNVADSGKAVIRKILEVASSGIKVTNDATGANAGTGDVKLALDWTLLGNTFSGINHTHAYLPLAGGTIVPNGVINLSNSLYGQTLRLGGNGGSDAGVAQIQTTNGNLHIDPKAGFDLYLGYYMGNGVIQFGNGASGIVATMDATGQLKQGTNTYWHAGNLNRSDTAFNASTVTATSYNISGSRMEMADSTSGRWKIGNGVSSNGTLRIIADSTSVQMDAVQWDNSSINKTLYIQPNGGASSFGGAVTVGWVLRLNDYQNISGASSYPFKILATPYYSYPAGNTLDFYVANGTPSAIESNNQIKVLSLNGAGNATFSGEVVAKYLTLGKNDGYNQWLHMNYGSNTSDYALIEFIEGGTIYSRIHAFSQNWQNSASSPATSSAGCINITGGRGVTIGVWNDPDLFIANGGNSMLRGSLSTKGQIRADIGIAATSFILTGSGSNFQIKHDGSSTVQLINSGGGGFYAIGQMRVGQNTNGTAVIDAYGSDAYFGCNTATNGMKIGVGGAATFSDIVIAKMLIGNITNSASITAVPAVARFSNSGGGNIVKLILTDDTWTDANITYESSTTAANMVFGIGVNGYKHFTINGLGNATFSGSVTATGGFIGHASLDLPLSGGVMNGNSPINWSDSMHGIVGDATLGMRIFTYLVPNGIVLQQVTGHVGIGYSYTDSPMTNYQFSVNGAGYFAGRVTAPSFTDGYNVYSAARIDRTGGYVELQYIPATGDGVRMFGSTGAVITFNTTGVISGQGFQSTGDFSICNTASGNGVAWYGRTGVKNAAADKATFVGTYGSAAVVGAHNYALNAWADLYVNCVNATGGGAVIIGASLTVGGSVTVSGSVTANGGGFNSAREIKDIHDDWGGSALNVIAKFRVRDFNYKTRPDYDRTLGFIIDEIPEEIGDYALSGAGKNAVNTYTLLGLSFKGLQEVKAKLDVQETESERQAKEIIKLKARILLLERGLN